MNSSPAANWSNMIARCREYVRPLIGAPVVSTGPLCEIDRRISRVGQRMVNYFIGWSIVLLAALICIRGLGPGILLFVPLVGYSGLAWQEILISWVLAPAQAFPDTTADYRPASELDPMVRARSIAVILEVIARFEGRLMPGLYDKLLNYFQDLLMAAVPQDHARLSKSQLEALYNILILPSSDQQLWNWQIRKANRDRLKPYAVRAIGVIGQADAIPILRNFIGYTQDDDLIEAAKHSIMQLEVRARAMPDELLRASAGLTDNTDLLQPAKNGAIDSPDEPPRSGAINQADARP
jgi:hypothetical protein